MDYTSQQQQPIGPPPRPKNWLIESILATIFCCLPFGVAGIVFAAQVNSKYDEGDYEGALRSSKEAGRWTKISFFVQLAIVILWGIGAIIWGGFFFWQSRNYNY
jgi:Interferon-induced transmembrane protein